MWIAREKDGTLKLFIKKPSQDLNNSWISDDGSGFELPKILFNDVDFEHGPINVAMFRTDRMPYTESMEKDFIKQAVEMAKDPEDAVGIGLNFMFNFLSIQQCDIK